jgi:hypothetical protein
MASMNVPQEKKSKKIAGARPARDKREKKKTAAIATVWRGSGVHLQCSSVGFAR